VGMPAFGESSHDLAARQVDRPRRPAGTPPTTCLTAPPLSLSFGPARRLLPARRPAWLTVRRQARLEPGRRRSGRRGSSRRPRRRRAASEYFFSASRMIRIRSVRTVSYRWAASWSAGSPPFKPGRMLPYSVHWSSWHEPYMLGVACIVRRHFAHFPYQRPTVSSPCS